MESLPQEPGLDIDQLAAQVRQLAESRQLAMAPAIPHGNRDPGLLVLLSTKEMSVDAFCDLAVAAGSRLLYLKAAPFDADTDLDQDLGADDDLEPAGAGWPTIQAGRNGPTRNRPATKGPEEHRILRGGPDHLGSPRARPDRLYRDIVSESARTLILTCALKIADATAHSGRWTKARSGLPICRDPGDNCYWFDHRKGAGDTGPSCGTRTPQASNEHSSSGRGRP